MSVDKGAVVLLVLLSSGSRVTFVDCHEDAPPSDAPDAPDNAPADAPDAALPWLTGFANSSSAPRMAEEARE